METKSEYKMTDVGEIPIDWEIEELKNISNIVTGSTPKTNIPNLWEGNYMFVTPSDMNGQQYMYNTERYITDEALELSRVIPKNSIMVTCIASIGKMAIATEECITNQQINTIIPSPNYYYKYLYYYLLKSKPKLELLASQTTVPIINKNTFSKFKVILPSLKEQQKIAEILSTVDEQIEQTDQLIEKTKELKKGLMQQLLAKGIGHTEFKQSKLGEIPVEWDIALFEDIMLSKGEGIRRGPFGGALKKEIFVEEGFAVYEQQHAIHKDINKFRYFVTPEKYDEMTAFNVKAGDILMSCSGTIGRVLLVPEDAPEGIINQALLRLRPKSYINLQFLKYLLQSEFVQNNILDRAHGSALKNMVAVSELKKIKLRIPQEEEQKKIASILTSVDEDIEGYEEEKSKYEELKKGLIQQLLTGKTRVKVD